MGPDMRIGITGASGFIGSALVEALRERGDDVICFIRPSTRANAPAGIRWDPSSGDVDERDLARVGGFDAVVNLAGAGIADRRWTPARRDEILRSRTASTELLVRAIGSMKSGAPMLASGSAIGFYGSRGDERLNETSSPGNDFLADVCRQWEQAALALGRQGATVALLRTGIVMSSRGGALKRQLPLFRLGLGGRLASGQQWVSPISLVDEVRAILWVLDHRSAGPFNLAAPQPLTNVDFTMALARQLRRRAPFAVPAAALRMALGAPLAIEVVLASQRVEPRALEGAGFVFEHANAAQILRAALVR